MTPLALAPPTAEPVTLAEARQFLRLDQTEEDDLLATLITAARLMIEAGAGRCLIEQRWRVVLDRWPADGAIRLPLSPVMRIEAARLRPISGTSPTMRIRGGSVLASSTNAASATGCGTPSRS